MKGWLRRIGAALLVLMLIFPNMKITAKAAPVVSGSDYTIEYNSSKMQLNWNAVSGANSYSIYRAQSRYGTYTYLGDVNGTSYVDNNPNGQKYSNYYRVVAKNNGAEISTKYMSLENYIFGDNMIFFANTDNRADINNKVADIYSEQETAQFGTGRYALMFKPGDYTNTDDFNVGFYTQIAGLGKLPTDVSLANASTPAFLENNNATCNFWRAIENVAIRDLDNNADVYFAFQWAVSQAAPARRLYVERNAVFDWWYGWASGGYAADCMFLKDAGSYSQQQYYMRNSSIGGNAYGVNWNFVLQGVTGGNLNTTQALLGGNGTSDWASGGKTTQLNNSPVIKEKPFLYLDGDEYKVFVPELRRNARGTSWSANNMGQGTSLSLDTFYIAKEGDSAATINAQLDSGKNVLFTPGIYYAEEPIRVTNPNTVVLGYGLATIIPSNNQAAMWVEDEDGIEVAGLIFDASSHSTVLLQVGNENASKDHSNNPILLSDLFFRVGGVYSGVASADMCLVINSDDVIGDHFWIWRADHGDGVGWDENVALNGLVVNGDDVTVYGLFNEHFEEYSTLWLGNGGKCYFYQYETPYDCVDQNKWKSHNGTKNGYAGYKVGNNVNSHYAVGLDLYEVFINTSGECRLDTAVEIPNKPNVIVENAMINTFSNTSVTGGILSIVNGTGSGELPGVMTTPGIVSAVNGVTTIRPNASNGDTYRQVNSIQPGDESFNGKTGIVYTYDKQPVIPDPDPELPVIKLTGTASASSNLMPAGNAVDGNTGTRWESTQGVDNQWIMVDLGSVKSVSRVYIDWETAAGKDYKIQTSTNGTTFTDVAHITNGTSGEDRTIDFNAVDARYVRVYGNTRTTQYGYSIFELEIYGSNNASGNPEPEPDPSLPDPGIIEGSFPITAPAHMSVKAAGLIDISWNAPAGVDVADYTVFINGQAVGTTTDTTYEYYTTKVQYFSVTVRANLTNGYTLDSDTTKFGITKKGLGLATDMGENLDLEALGLGWYYNWSEFESPAANYANTEFVPMMWKETDRNAAENRISALVDRGFKYVLTFNEPEYPDQCNMSVDDVFEVYKGCQNDNILISAPTTALWPQVSTDWFQPFIARVDQTPNMDYDFIAIHCYPEDYGGVGMAEWFIENVIDYTWEHYHKPIWITEFSTHGQWVTATGENGTKEFWEAVMPMLDEREYVVRYAGFDFDDDAVGLWRYATGALTPAGEVYKRLGNPVNTNATYTLPAGNPLPEGGGSGSGGSGSGSGDAVKLNATATASTEMQSASNAVDGNEGSRWESTHGLDNQWLTLDLGSVKNVSRVKIKWETAAGKEYRIETSVNGSNWDNAITVTNGTNGATLDESFAARDARYVRMYGVSRTTGYGYSIFEMEVYGTDSANGGSTGGGNEGGNGGGNEGGNTGSEVTEITPVSASASTEYQSASLAIDKNAGSRWESTHGLDNQWLSLDLGSLKSVSKVVIDWETAAGKNYVIQVSADGNEWTPVYTVTNGGNGETKTCEFDAVNARYVRMYGTERTTQYGYSIYEMSVYGAN